MQLLPSIGTKLIADVCADWAVSTAIKEQSLPVKVLSQARFAREHAHTSIESALNFATSAGQS